MTLAHGVLLRTSESANTQRLLREAASASGPDRGRPSARTGRSLRERLRIENFVNDRFVMRPVDGRPVTNLTKE